MRSSARPVLLRSLKVIGGATALSSEAVVATRLCLCADDEILIESVLLSGIWYQSLSFILTKKSVLFCISQWYNITQAVTSRKGISPFSFQRMKLADTRHGISSLVALPGRNSLHIALAGARRY